MLSGLTYNIHFGQKIDKIIDWLSHISPPFDVICFQEFPFSQIPLLTRFSLQAPYAYHTALSFKHANKEYGQLTLLNTKKIKIMETETIYLGTSFWEGKVLGFTGGRSALVTKCTYKNTEFTLINTHFVAFGSNKHRRSQMEKIIDRFNTSYYSNTPLIILGDLNYSSLTGQGSLIKLMKLHAFKNAHTFNTHRLLNIKDHQLDYIFYKNIQVTQSKVLNLSFSDHRPIIFTLELLKENK